MLLNTPLILLFCNAPFTDRNRTFVHLRSGRIKWLCGQILYIIMASGIFFLTMLAESAMFAGHGAKFTLDWDEASLALPAVKELSAYFTPLGAVGFTLLFSWLSGIFIGLLMFLCNYMKERFRPSFAYVMCGYCGLTALLVTAIPVFGRRKSLDIRED